MTFPDTLGARAVGRNKLLPCVIFSSYQIHASSVYDRKLKDIGKDLRRISEQSKGEMVANMAQDDSTIAGWVVDLNELLVDYQVILGNRSHVPHVADANRFADIHTVRVITDEFGNDRE
jgi:hypothetical protein